MHLKTRNVNTGFKDLVLAMSQTSIPGAITLDNHVVKGSIYLNACTTVSKPSRNGNVKMIDEPVLITYTHPRERVLFNAARDANPFFHLYEALWMLTGRNDVAPLAYYVKKMADFSDDGKTQNGAYGYRWRHSQVPDHQNWENGDGVDQLDILVNHLKAEPNSRRAVLQMWNVEDDLLELGSPTPAYKADGSAIYVDDRGCPIFMPGASGRPASKDVCCNLSVMFSLRETGEEKLIGSLTDRNARHPVMALDMTVTNRSNDMIWGTLGANYVHFTILQDYMAARLGVEVGLYHHFTNNLHVYENNWKPEEWLADTTSQYPYQAKMICMADTALPLVKAPAVFEMELPIIVEQYSGKQPMETPFREYTEPFLAAVAQPMFDAFLSHKMKTSTALEHCERIKAGDWRRAAIGWIQRRNLNKEKVSGT